MSHCILYVRCYNDKCDICMKWERVSVKRDAFYFRTSSNGIYFLNKNKYSAFVFFFHTVITEKGETTTSYLLIQRARPKDSGKYKCSPSNAIPVTIHVHVLNGEWLSAWTPFKVHTTWHSRIVPFRDFRRKIMNDRWVLFASAAEHVHFSLLKHSMRAELSICVSQRGKDAEIQASTRTPFALLKLFWMLFLKRGQKAWKLILILLNFKFIQIILNCKF